MTVKTNVISNSTPVEILKNRVQQNWNNRKVEVIASGATTAALISGVVAASLLGPLGLIIGLSAAAFMGLGLFLTSLASKPKNVTQEVPAPEAKEVAVVKEEVAQPAQVVKETLAQRAKNHVTAHPYKTILGAVAAVATGYGLYAGYNVYAAMEEGAIVAKLVEMRSYLEEMASKASTSIRNYYNNFRGIVPEAIIPETPIATNPSWLQYAKS